MDVENDHLLDDENCHRHAIEWLRVYLYKSAEPEKRRQWNRTRFILQADKPADKQLERYFELLRNLQLDLPAYMHHTGILAAKLDFVFGKHAWYLWDQTDIDLGADDGPDKVLEKAKRAYRRLNDIRNAVAAAKSTTLEDNFRINDSRLQHQQRPPNRRPSTIPERHMMSSPRNPVDRSGKVMECTGCDSLTHLYKQCTNPERESHRERKLRKIREMKAKRPGSHRAAEMERVYCVNLMGVNESYGLFSGEMAPPSTPQPERQDASPDVKSASETDGVSVDDVPPSGQDDELSGADDLPTIDDVHFYDAVEDTDVLRHEAGFLNDMRMLSSFSVHDSQVPESEHGGQIFPTRLH